MTDSSGLIPLPQNECGPEVMVCNASNSEGSTSYINDQSADPYGSMTLGRTTVAHGGCGIVASYNALRSLGKNPDFNEVLAYYNKRESDLLFGGTAGMLPSLVASYFRDLGYTVIVTEDYDGIEIFSKTADACIMWYLYDLGVSIKGIDMPFFGGHFIEYGRYENEYIAHNAATVTGVDYFHYPMEYASRGSRFYAIGIFIYE